MKKPGKKKEQYTHLWSHRCFIVGQGWQPWEVREVKLIAETKLYYKVGWKVWFVFLSEWIPKESQADIIEEIKEMEIEKG